MSAFGTKVVKGGAKHLPLVYTAREACEAVAKMMTDMVTCGSTEEGVYAQLLAAVAHGKVAPIGFVDGQVVFGLPTAAPWNTDRQPAG